MSRPSRSTTKSDILATVIPLFATKGRNGVTMRDIAREVGLNPASLYHHFPDKETLYLEAVKQAFAAHSTNLRASLEASLPAVERLRLFVSNLVGNMQRHQDFRRLIQRELLDGDDQHLQLLAEQILACMFAALSDLCRELSPDYDPGLLASSILSLVVHHHQLARLRLHLPGFRAEHNDPQTVACHITRLLLHGLLPRPESR